MNDDSTIDYQEFEELSGETELSPPELFAANLIEWALERHASDLFVSDIDGAILISVRRLGKIQPVRRLAQAYGRRLQGHLKVLVGADPGDNIHPVDGRALITTPDGSSGQLRLSSLPTLYGQDVAIRLFDPVRGARNLNQLGMDDADSDSLNRIAEHSSGLILVTGPVASGKSSTLYAMIDKLNDGSRKIHTIEDPIEHSVSGVMQSQVNLRAKLDFADMLTVVLRHSPDVIMIGEVRDSKTAQTAIRAGASGQLVLATVHANSAAEAIDMMLQYDGNHKFLASALIGVVNQRLVRRLCLNCRTEVNSVSDENSTMHEISERVRSRMGDQPVSLSQANGCHVCHDGGYDSLINMPEIMVVDAEIKAAISNRATAAEVEALAVERGMLPIADVARSYIYKGMTTVEEVNRVINDPDLALMQTK